MRWFPGRPARSAAVALTVVLAMSACSLGGGAVPRSELEKDVATELNEQSGQDNDATCDGELEAEEKATQACTWTNDDGDEIPVEVTATRVDGEDVEYDIRPQQGASQSPSSVARSEVEKDVATELNKRSGQDKDATCDDDLEADKGSSVRCTWGGGDDGVPVQVTVTSVNGSDVDYDIEPEGAPGGSSVSRAVLERKVRKEMAAQTQKSFPVTCKGGLAGKMGATQRCIWKASDGSTLGIDVELTGYSKGQANFHIQADDEATPAPKDSRSRR